ncbi:hypothetical protein PA25_23430 [Pseudoalteromonas sp. A25]|uniref:DUF6445 family protein n=1 Tax=Pseudoalteromonas sp. A25 TaxID=116092 RepID=UPI00126080FD|nr:DUF6445 family protein [Pseudoalteromonas sp. A25]BBN82358.1 hypothetical protein PA25_23430 [Pseudoalteromonas sp. A25]
MAKFVHTKLTGKEELPAIPNGFAQIPYEKPQEGKNFWVADNFFSDEQAMAIRKRCLNKQDWKLGKPYTEELWPGRRSPDALTSEELEQVEQWVKAKLGKDKLWVADSDKVVVDTNTAILVGDEEGAARPHVDNRQLCRYAAVLYLTPNPRAHSGTSFYRLRYANHAAGGNAVYAPYRNLVDALNIEALPISAWYEDVEIENRFNRLALFKGNLAHSASDYFGDNNDNKRLAVTFFWMTDDE